LTDTRAFQRLCHKASAVKKSEKGIRLAAQIPGDQNRSNIQGLEVGHD
jgi:hypothetical protein